MAGAIAAVDDDLRVKVEAGDVGGGLGGARGFGVDDAERGPAGTLAEQLDAARGPRRRTLDFG